ncbi:unnamed protein product [Pelagomonas calceolata]|uniref:Uncharacterized protein n=1 Tax=Pelagomonas calceolata TaxID=35677 RepID=A0A8J2T229_9STRA|nr:unnamed protein product [Pelagomonas calceolata]
MGQLLSSPSPQQSDAPVASSGTASSMPSFTVIIKHNATTVIAVKQRDLFSKYRWPAAPKILERLEMLKEDLED